MRATVRGATGGGGSEPLAATSVPHAVPARTGGDVVLATPSRRGLFTGIPPRRDLFTGIPSRRDLFTGLCILGFVNAVFASLSYRLVTDPVAALGSLAGVSVLVWIAMIVAIHMVRRVSDEPASRRDLLAGGASLLLLALPPAPLNWLALTAIGFYLAASGGTGTPERRAGLIVVALCVPMFWSKIVMSTMSGIILRADAALAALLLNTERTGNAVAFADGWGYFWIAPECSSLSNISIAVLCWIVLGQGAIDRRAPGFAYCIAAIVAVVTLNVARLALTGLSRAHYEVLHGPIGDFTFDFLSVAAIAAILALGWRRGGTAGSGSQHAALG